MSEQTATSTNETATGNANQTNLLVALAADTYQARQTRISNPTGYFKGNRFYLSEAEYQFVPEEERDRLNPSSRFPYSLLNYGRTKNHIARLFGVSVEELAAEVKRRNQQRRRRDVRKQTSH